MRIWMTEVTEIANGILGYVDIRPDSAGQFLIDNDYAVDAKEADNLPGPHDGKQAIWGGSQATISVSAAPSVVIRPVVTGNGTTVGSLLTCQSGVYFGVPAPSATKQWMRDGTQISGATGPSYLTTAEDAGTAISVLETATNASGSIAAGSNEINIT